MSFLSNQVHLLSLWKVTRGNGEAWLIHHCFIDTDNMPWAIVSKMLDPKWRMFGLERGASFGEIRTYGWVRGPNPDFRIVKKDSTEFSH